MCSSDLPQADHEAREWQERQSLSKRLRDGLAALPNGASAADQAPIVRPLLNPYWGFERTREPAVLARILRDPGRGLHRTP